MKKWGTYMNITVHLEGIASKYTRDNKGSVIIEMYEGARVKDIQNYIQLPVDREYTIVKNGTITSYDEYLEPDDVILMLPKFSGQ